MITKEQKRAYKQEIAQHKEANRRDLTVSKGDLKSLEKQLKKLRADHAREVKKLESQCIRIAAQSAERVDRREKRIAILTGRL